jgi:hypothetical protein
MNIFMTYNVEDLHRYYINNRTAYVKSYNIEFTFVDYLLEIAREMNNNKPYRTIKAVPTRVFDELETNKQTINYVYYPLYKKGTIVINRPETKGAFSYKLFNFDPEPYIIVDTRGRKYRLGKLIDNIEGNLEPGTK